MSRVLASARTRRHRSALGAFVLGLVALPASLCGEEAPTLIRRGGHLALTGIPDLLSGEEVREHLTSGLTTTFTFRVTVSDRQRRRASTQGWIALRYDLWDEVFQLATGGFFGERRRRVGSFDELVDGWRSPAAAVWSVEGLAAGEPWQVRIEVDLIPFSRSEQRDTQRWLADSLGGRESGPAESVAESAEDGPDPATNVFNLLIATSIRRDSLITWSWTVEVPPPPETPP